MLFLLRRMKLRSGRLEDLLAFQNINYFKKSNLKYQKYGTRTELAVHDNSIKNYLKAVSKAYTDRLQDEEFMYLVKIREVIQLIEHKMKIEENIENLVELVSQDDEMKKLGEEEQLMYKEQLQQVDEELLETIMENLGKDICREIIFEISAGVGGTEAMIFGADLLNMYQSYFERLGYGHETLELKTETGLGGIRHASLLVSGDRAFQSLRYEGGVHRVQRVPATEKYGRMHTSTVSVAVLPRPTDIDVQIKDKDLKIDTKRATGAGGQHANTTDSAVRITHIPTGIVVEAQSERSQIKNRKIAMIKLQTRIYESQLNEQKEKTGSLRKKQKGLGLRNEKIRTYNFSQDRITDHRITNGTMHNLKGFMENGQGLEELHDKLQRQMQLQLLQEAIESWQ